MVVSIFSLSASKINFLQILFGNHLQSKKKILNIFQITNLTVLPFNALFIPKTNQISKLECLQQIKKKKRNILLDINSFNLSSLLCKICLCVTFRWIGIVYVCAAIRYTVHNFFCSYAVAMFLYVYKMNSTYSHVRMVNYE